MPNVATIQPEAHDEAMVMSDFWLNVADAPIEIQKSVDQATGKSKVLTFKWTRLDGEVVELPLLGGSGSSSLIDSDKDIFHKEALDTVISTARPRMGTYRNHKFEVPYDNIGNLADVLDEQGRYVERGLKLETKLQDAGLATQIAASYGGQSIKLDADFGIITIKSTVNIAIQQALDTYNAIMNGAEFGWSIGCMYRNAKRREGPRGLLAGFDVYAVETKEFSIVSLPANPLAWCDAVAKGLVARGVIPPRASDPEFARVVSNWPDFDKRLKGQIDGSDLEQAALAAKLHLLFDWAKQFGIVPAYDPMKRRLW